PLLFSSPLRYISFHSFSSSLPPPPSSTLFPYTTLFRSALAAMTPVTTFAKGNEILASSDTKVISEKKIEKLSDWELRAARYEITDRKSTRLNSSHVSISYAVFCLKKKKKKKKKQQETTK